MEKDLNTLTEMIRCPWDGKLYKSVDDFPKEEKKEVIETSVTEKKKEK